MITITKTMTEEQKNQVIEEVKKAIVARMQIKKNVRGYNNTDDLVSDMIMFGFEDVTGNRASVGAYNTIWTEQVAFGGFDEINKMIHELV